MFAVDHESLSKAEFELRLGRFGQAEPFGEAGAEHACYAICSPDAAFVVAMAYYIRQGGGSVLLLFGETPQETALALATRAQCRGLFYGADNRYIALNAGNEPVGKQPSLYQYSSGTTGEPKLIGRTWDEIGIEIAGYNEMIVASGQAEATPVILASVTHSFGLITGVFAAIERGVQPVVCVNKNPKAILQLLRVHPNHLIYSVPSLLQSLIPLLEHAGVSLNAIISSGAPMSPALYSWLNGKTKLLMQQYGCTEAGCASLAPGMESYDDIGLPLPHMAIPAEAEPAELKFFIDGLGEIATGDLGCRSESGRLRFLGRIDDLINVSGLKVMPVEVEGVIGQLDGVQEVVVFRGQHPSTGEMVKARVVADETVTAERVRAWCLSQLPPYKAPTDVKIVNHIPKMPSGKISRKLLEREGI
ncbi:AMP-binding protein [Paenibacillus sp. GCM10027627]|uniref:AMP-binding protein n=1 Tax=unclassified Paenibacillus TaxID=185978 RepID=UPI0036411DC1